MNSLPVLEALALRFNESVLQGSTLPALLDEYAIDKIDILHIDTEGYDWNILSQLDLNKYQPSFILFESNHLSEIDIKAVKKFLAQRYILFDAGIDILAVNIEKHASVIKQIYKSIKALSD